jgi:flagellar basal-body rod protein FlgG
MVEGLYTAAAGMSAQQVKLDAISNDLANLSTTGYKAQRVAFSDLLYGPVRMAGTSTEAGAGAAAGPLGRNASEGALKETGRPLDLTIEGDGYFQVTDASGRAALTRDGSFELDAAGSITTAEGARLSPPITVPAGSSAANVRVASDGTVTAGTRRLGRIALVTVPAPDRLLSEGGGLLHPTAASGEVRPASSATIRQGALEQSNVDLGREMADLTSTERSFQLASSAVQTESQMMSIANQLRA